MFNCALDQELGAYTLYTTGITEATSVVPPIVREPISVTASRKCGDLPISLRSGMWIILHFQLLLTTLFSIKTLLAASATFQVTGGARSLHSNRNYEVGMVYMDDFGRSTTALVSSINSVYFPCDRSDLKNQIRVKLYHLLSLRLHGLLSTSLLLSLLRKGIILYCPIFLVYGKHKDLCYVLLQGENARKVEEGDRLIVKRDTSGPVNKCDYVTVLEKKVFGEESAELDRRREDYQRELIWSLKALT